MGRLQKPVDSPVEEVSYDNTFSTATAADGKSSIAASIDEASELDCMFDATEIECPRLSTSTSNNDEDEDDDLPLCNDKTSDQRHPCPTTIHEQEPLSVCEELKERLIDALAGTDATSRAIVSEGIGSGRCNVQKTFVMPDVHIDSRVSFDLLKHYQQAGLQWLLTLHEHNRNGIVADEMGLGKTALTCVFLNDLYCKELLDEPTVIACPAGLVDNWCVEIRRWAPALRYLKYHGTQKERRDKIAEYDNADEDTHLIVTSLQTLIGQWDRSVFFKHIQFGYLVVDEAHNLKNSESRTYQKMKFRVRAQRRLLITGSPIQNQISELRNLLLFIMDDLFSAKQLERSLIAFRRIRNAYTPPKPSSISKRRGTSKTVGMLTGGGEATGNAEGDNSSQSSSADSKSKRPPTEEECDIEFLQTILAPFILRRLKEEVINDLPSKTRVVVRCEMNGRQLQLYCREIKNIRSSLANFKGSVSRKTLQPSAAAASTPPVSGSSSADSRRRRGRDPQQTPDAGESQHNVSSNSNGSQSVASSTATDSSSSRKRKQMSSQPGSDADSPSVTTEGSVGGREGVEDNYSLVNDKSSSTGSSSAFVKATVFRLRRICNHVLLLPHQYTAELKEVIIVFCRSGKSYRFGDAPYEAIVKTLDGWCDFDFHAWAVYELRERRLPLSDPSDDRNGGDALSPEKRRKILDFDDFHDHANNLQRTGAFLRSLLLPPDAFLESTKVRKMLEILKEKEGEKTLIFSQFTTFLDVIEETFRFHIPDMQYFRLDGSTPVRERQAMVDEFDKDPEIKVFMLSTKAGGVGLNLTAANVVILMDQDWNPHNDRQAEDRVHRLGQKKDVSVFRICCEGSIEELILQCCKKKLDLDNAFGGMNSTDFLSLDLLKNSINTARNQLKVEDDVTTTPVTGKAPGSLIDQEGARATAANKKDHGTAEPKPEDKVEQQLPRETKQHGGVKDEVPSNDDRSVRQHLSRDSKRRKLSEEKGKSTAASRESKTKSTSRSSAGRVNSSSSANSRDGGNAEGKSHSGNNKSAESSSALTKRSTRRKESSSSRSRPTSNN
eukprot:Lankesteria_metandrocarpae@DN5630_c0_g1_i1.p1